MKKGKYQLQRFGRMREFMYEVGRAPIVYEPLMEVIPDDHLISGLTHGANFTAEEYLHVRKCTNLVLQAINGCMRMFNDPSLEERLQEAFMRALATDTVTPIEQRGFWKVDPTDLYLALDRFECNKGVSLHTYLEDYMDERIDFMEHTYFLEGLVPTIPEAHLDWCDALALSLAVLEVDFMTGAFIYQTGDSQLVDLDTQCTDLLLDTPHPRKMGGNGLLFMIAHPVQLRGAEAMVLHAHECVAMVVVGVV